MEAPNAEGIQASAQRIMEWAKKHPVIAGLIVIVVILAGWWISKSAKGISSGGNFGSSEAQDEVTGSFSIPGASTDGASLGSIEGSGSGGSGGGGGQSLPDPVESGSYTYEPLPDMSFSSFDTTPAFFGADSPVSSTSGLIASAPKAAGMAKVSAIPAAPAARQESAGVSSVKKAISKIAEPVRNVVSKKKDKTVKVEPPRVNPYTYGSPAWLQWNLRNGITSYMAPVSASSSQIKGALKAR